MEAIDIFIQDRQLIYREISRLPLAAYTIMPAGFDNNIAWNLGHIIVVQQRLHYALSGNEMLTPDHYLAMYLPGTSPADWEREPDVKELLGFLQEMPAKLKEDYDAGIFQNYTPYTTSTGITLNNIEAAIAFNNFHEGVHVGAILALNNFILPSLSGQY